MPVQEQAMAQMAHIASQSTTALKESLDNPLLHAPSVMRVMERRNVRNAQEPSTAMELQNVMMLEIALKESLGSSSHHAQGVKLGMERQTVHNVQEPNTVTEQPHVKLWQLISV